jgi:hypothetical protein
MTDAGWAATRRRLDIQGFERVDDGTLAPVARWLRLAFALCALLAAVGTIMGSPAVLLVLAAIALLAGLSPVHPFDLIYNHGIRRFTGTGPLPRRGAPSRFACGMGAVLLVVVAWLFAAGHVVAGYVLGGALTATATLVATTDVCLPSLMYRAVRGFPARRVASDGT